MSGSGVSLQTTIAQATNAAQTQLKGQQTHHATTPLSEKLDQSKDTTIQHVRRPEKTDHERVQPDPERERRRRRAQERERERRAGAAPDAPGDAAAAGAGGGDGGEAGPADGMGRLIDTKA
jgi:hypothetical protein